MANQFGHHDYLGTFNQLCIAKPCELHKSDNEGR
jgi:hypothetical protein